MLVEHSFTESIFEIYNLNLNDIKNLIWKGFWGFGGTLTSLLGKMDPAEVSLAVSERRTRARTLAGAALKRLDF